MKDNAISLSDNSTLRCTYQVVYKCPLCGRINYVPQQLELTEAEADEFLIQCLKNQTFAGHPVLHKVPMHVRCKCPNGSFGLAPLSGLVKL